MDDLLQAYGCPASKRIRIDSQHESDDSDDSDNDVVVQVTTIGM